ncbi:ABC transporter substrate-binding protein [Roseicella aquatilis]|uniref:Branched-chain amino acid ABC transporter substrate-binding protein n=1 Tax=Roseicella aquatilis TaxID=2527868 RepID=A0A4R4DTF1_9PROT|nr:ABC transporter substrate-binding protein [Roseicella aquatilis]TCZ64893.1 branched-chain amino acid ABC transporter substrate-binding protein [Roseicella aquatilis]
MRRTRPRPRRSLLPALLLGLLLSCAAAAEPAPVLGIGYLAWRPPPARPVASTLLDPPPEDEGVQGARLGLADNETTGRFTGQRFALEERIVRGPEEALEALRGLAAAGIRLVVADLPAPLLLRAAGLPEAEGVTLLNTGAPDDALRNEACRRNLLHILPSRAMLADALAQYLAVKRWRNLVLAVGPEEGDRLYAEAMRRAARKFGLRLVADRAWTYDPGAQRTDTGHLSIAAEAARFTQGTPAHDVLVVADEAGQGGGGWGGGWGDGLAYRTTEPRPIAGTHGLTPTLWSRVHEQWGATQLQRRFRARAGRWMTPRDHAGWLALRAIGEGATRARSTDPAAVLEAMRGPEFGLAGFKGTRLTFRDWDGQLRQPVLLAEPRALVSVSPQPGFQHQFSELDTLGTDRPETRCRLP